MHVPPSESGRRVARLRSDARANRERILSAARALFVERGVGVTNGEIARRAGIGSATLHRHFSNRDQLLVAVFAERVDECVVAIVESSRDPDPWRGFTAAADGLCTVDADSRGLMRAFLTAVPGGESLFDDQRRQAERAFAALIHRAKESGQLRMDFGRDDLTLLLMANSGLTHRDVAARKAASRRLVGLLLEAFHTGTAG